MLDGSPHPLDTTRVPHDSALNVSDTQRTKSLSTAKEKKSVLVEESNPAETEERPAQLPPHRFQIFRVRSAEPIVRLRPPSAAFKILCGSVVVCGPTVVLSSYPSLGATVHHLDPSDALRGVTYPGPPVEWVVEHLPASPTAAVEVAIVCVYDPEGFVVVQCRSVRQPYINAEDDHHHGFHALGQVSHGGVVRGEQEKRWEYVTVRCAVTEDQGALVGGGFQSLQDTPPVHASPLWGKLWSATVPLQPNVSPLDALCVYSIAARMSVTHQEQYRSGIAAAAGGGDAAMRTIRSYFRDDDAQWRVRFPPPFGDMCALLGATSAQHPVAQQLAMKLLRQRAMINRSDQKQQQQQPRGVPSTARKAGAPSEKSAATAASTAWRK